MERVAFLIQQTGERIECLLNPESFTITRQAGVRQRKSLNGGVTNRLGTDDTLLATGGGTTELILELLFDVSKVPPPNVTENVRDLTAPLWNLAENGVDVNEHSSLPAIRFVWGKSWNIPGIVTTIAERFESFTSAGTPRRSWVKMRFLRIMETTNEPRPSLSSLPFAQYPKLAPEGGTQDQQTHEVIGESTTARAENVTERIDQLANRYYGDPSYWRLLASFNGLDDPSRLKAGTGILIPRPHH